MKRMIFLRVISLFLILCMAASMLPMSVFAAETKGTAPTAPLQQNLHNPFADVSKTDWFYDAVMYARQNGIFSGAGAGTFLPDGTMTRAMYVTVLGRIAGINVSKYKASVFSDVTVDMWYAPYAAWAADRGITAGTGNGRFSPDTPVTREQMATMTVRYFESYKIPYETVMQITSQPKDKSSISPWALDAVLALWRAGLFKGDAEGNFRPGSNATRAEAVTCSMRISTTVQVWAIQTQPPSTPTPKPAPTPAPAPAVQPGNDGGGGNDDPVTYTVTFDTNGGNTINSRSLKEGTILKNLPTPYKMNSIFLGWYEDSGLSKLISDSGTLKGNMTLYAKYVADGGTNEAQSIPSVSKLDQAKNFTIEVEDATGNRTSEQIEEAMNFESPSNPDFAGIAVTGSDGHFAVAAQGGVFEEGASYKLSLKDQNLTFKGEDKSTAIFNFTIARQTVMNLDLNSGLVYIPASDVSGMTQNGDSVPSLSVGLASVSNSGPDLSTVDLNSGTFTYNGTGIEVGKTVAIYEGIRPDQRNLNTGETDAGNVAYVTITAVNGNTYTYGNADSRQVLFTPDILPVSNAADTDGDSNNHSITIEKNILNYSDSKYAPIGLDANTTVDAGDFISLYTGTFGDPSSTIAGYGKITDVTASGNNCIIAYTDTTLDQAKAAMDLYNQKYVEGEKLLENTDVAGLEAEIEQQAQESGFMDQASEYLAALALDTDSFKKLDGDFDLESYHVSLSDDTPVTDGQVQLMGGSKVKVENKTIHARLSTALEHFAGLSGVRCALEIGCDIVIDAGEDNEIVIHVSGTFEQEVRIKVGVNGGAVWKTWWIFPYIADYRMNGNIDTYTYTGIRVKATIGTFEKDAEWDWSDESKVQDIGKQIKELMDKKDQYIGDGINTVSGTLADKYSEMLENDSDWIDLFEKELFSQESFVDPFHILVVGVKLSFVVSAKMNISIGCDFYYENAKRYIFTIGILSNTRSNNTIDLVEERYQFTFYVMGTLGLRAGIRLEVSAGLFSLKLDSIGFVVEVGAYVQLWGYFYYELTYTASTGKTSKYSGALYLEFGVYLEISFKAQLFNGTFEYNPTLYENEWPLLSAGSQQNVCDFSYSVADTPKVSMAKTSKSFVMPDSTFSMSYMDMKTGETDNKAYDDSTDFTIEMTNSDFGYNPANNTVTVIPGNKVTEDGEMVVIWKGAPLAFTSAPISRTIKLHWENLKSAYSISFNSNGGSATGAISLPYNVAIKAPADPQKTGYVFGGWYKDQNCTQAYTIPAIMPAEDIILYAKWTSATNTKYTVEHYQQNLINDLYTLADTDSLTATTDADANPACRTYEGFTAPAAQSIAIKADGSAVLKYYYTRNGYTLTFNANGGTGGSTAQVKYCASIAAPIVTKQGYTFAGWSPDVAGTMPAQNTTYTAQWTAISAAAYKVDHYQQNVADNDYTLAQTENLSGIPGATATATTKSYTGFTHDSNAAGTVASGNIAADGSLVLKLHYTRNNYTLTFDANGGTGGSTDQKKYGASMTIPSVTNAGCTFICWSPAVADTMPAQDTTYTAKWSAAANTVSTFNDLVTALADNSISEVVVAQAIELPDGTNLDGKGKTVRAAITGTDTNGNIQDGSAYNIFTIANGSTVTIRNLTVKGGKYSAVTNAGTLGMNGVTIAQSGASGGGSTGGGGLKNTGKAVLKDCMITGNVADYGAGFLNSGNGAIMIMDNCTVTSNNSTRGGGGSENNNSAMLYLNNCTFSNNVSSEIGGAINNFYGTLYVLNSTITGNMSNTSFSGVCGGGIGNNGGTLYVVNSLITNNFEKHSTYDAKASDIGVYSNGGGIWLYNSYCGAYVTNVTENLAETGAPVNSTSSTVNPVGNGLTGIFDSYTQWNGLDCPALAKQADGTYTAPLAANSEVMSGGCDVYFDYSSSGVTIAAYGNTPVYLIGTSGGTRITVYQGGGARTSGVIGAFGN